MHVEESVQFIKQRENVHLAQTTETLGLENLSHTVKHPPVSSFLPLLLQAQAGLHNPNGVREGTG